MSEENKSNLETQLWDISRDIRKKMDGNEFRDYTLGFIFYKYLSEKMNLFGDKLLKEDNLLFTQIDENSSSGKEYLKIIKQSSIDALGYFLNPS